MSEPKVLYVQRPVVGGVWDFQPADDVELIAAVRAGVESGTIKGADLWIECPHCGTEVIWTPPALSLNEEKTEDQ